MCADETAARAALDEQLAQLVDDAQSATEEAVAAMQSPPADDPKKEPKGRGRRDLSQSPLPQVVVDFTDPALESHGADRMGFDETRSLMLKRTSASILVMRTVKYRVDTPTGPLIESAPLATPFH